MRRVCTAAPCGCQKPRCIPTGGSFAFWGHFGPARFCFSLCLYAMVHKGKIHSEFLSGSKSELAQNFPQQKSGLRLTHFDFLSRYFLVKLLYCYGFINSQLHSSMPTCEFWANPVNFRLHEGIGYSSTRRQLLACRRRSAGARGAAGRRLAAALMRGPRGGISQCQPQGPRADVQPRPRAAAAQPSISPAMVQEAP
jgi:hypothetical protein